MSEVVITGEPPMSGRQALAVVIDEGRQAVEDVNALVHREVLARMARNRRTGTSMRSVWARIEFIAGMIQGTIGSNHAPVKWLDRGTGLYGPLNHWIEPKHAQALRWPNRAGGGFTLAGRRRSGRAGANASYIFAKRVRGIRPRRYFHDAHLVTEPRAIQIFEQHAERAAERIARGDRAGMRTRADRLASELH